MEIKEPSFQKSLKRTGSFHEIISILYIKKMLFDQLLNYLRIVVKYQDGFSDSLEPQLCIRTSLIPLRITQRHTDIYTYTRSENLWLSGSIPITARHWILLDKALQFAWMRNSLVKLWNCCYWCIKFCCVSHCGLPLCQSHSVGRLLKIDLYLGMEFNKY